MTNDEAAIRKNIDTWLSATASGDVKTVLSLMTEDCLFLTAGQPPFGKKEFAQGSEGMKDLNFEGKPDVQEIQVAGDWAWVRNALTIKMTMPDGTVTRLAGQTLSVFRKENGAWLLARDGNFVAPI